MRYEINPPKIIRNNVVLNSIEINRLLFDLKHKVYKISKNCNGIHITDSVLGIPRVSPIMFTNLIKREVKAEITTSLRVRDRNITSITQYIYDALVLKINGILIINGDSSNQDHNKSKLIPSNIVKHFNQTGVSKKIKFFLSISNNPDFKKITKKIDAEPNGFVTQIINNTEQISRIVDKLKPQGFKIIPCILLPSKKNIRSSLVLGIDWTNYKDRVLDFIKEVHEISNDMIITSPNDFSQANKIFKELKS